MQPSGTGCPHCLPVLAPSTVGHQETGRPSPAVPADTWSGCRRPSAASSDPFAALAAPAPSAPADPFAEAPQPPNPPPVPAHQGSGFSKPAGAPVLHDLPDGLPGSRSRRFALRKGACAGAPGQPHVLLQSLPHPSSSAAQQPASGRSVQLTLGCAADPPNKDPFASIAATPSTGPSAAMAASPRLGGPHPGAAPGLAGSRGAPSSPLKQGSASSGSRSGQALPEDLFGQPAGETWPRALLLA